MIFIRTWSEAAAGVVGASMCFLTRGSIYIFGWGRHAPSVITSQGSSPPSSPWRWWYGKRGGSVLSVAQARGEPRSPRPRTSHSLVEAQYSIHTSSPPPHPPAPPPPRGFTLLSLPVPLPLPLPALLRRYTGMPPLSPPTGWYSPLSAAAVGPTAPRTRKLPGTFLQRTGSTEGVQSKDEQRKQDETNIF